MNSRPLGQIDTAKSDWVDGALFAWMAAYFLTSSRVVPVLPFPQGHVLVGLGLLVIISGLRVTQVKAPLQALCACLFCLASAGIAASISWKDQIVEVCVPIVLLYGSFALSRVFLSRCFGLTVTMAQDDFRIRSALRTPHYVAFVVAVAGTALQFMHDPLKMVVVVGLWLIPYGMLVVFVWRLPVQYLPTFSESPSAWRAALGGPLVISLFIGVASLSGVAVTSVIHRNVPMSVLVALICVLQGLLVVGLLRRAFRSEAA